MGLIFCYNDAELAAEHVADENADSQQQTAVPQGFWFANQVVSDACATIAMLNILFNLDEHADFEVGEQLNAFRRDTSDFEPKVTNELYIFFVLRAHRGFR